MPTPKNAKKKTPAWVVPTVVLVLVGVVALALILVNSGDDAARPEEPSGSPGSTTGAVASVETITSIPPEAFDAAGVQGVEPGRFAPIPDAPPLEEDGKPLVLYIGAEFCPFCAGQRWAVVAALSRFGEFDGLEESYSALDDVYPGTKTVTFHGSSYTSDYVAFQGLETSDSEYQTLDELTPEQEAIFAEFNAPPYVDPDSAGAIPFTDFGNQFVLVGATVPVEAMQGMSAQQIAEDAADPNTQIGSAVLGTANMISAIICDQNGGKPADVCTSAGVQAGAEALGL